MNNTYSKQLHTFTENGETINAVIYGGLAHPNDISGNFHIIDNGEGSVGGRYLMELERDNYLTDDLKSLEVILFEFMQSEGFEYDSQS